MTDLSFTSLFNSSGAAVPSIQDGRGNSAKVAEGLPFRGSITQVINGRNDFIIIMIYLSFSHYVMEALNAYMIYRQIDFFISYLFKDVLFMFHYIFALFLNRVHQPCPSPALLLTF